MNKPFEFEPNATPPLLMRMRETADSPGYIDGADFEFMYSVTVGGACVAIDGVYDAAREGFEIDLSLLADVVRPRVSYTGYFYIDRGTGWIRVGTMKIKPIIGCVWQPVEVVE